MARLDRIMIVGGGTAGWLTACYLAKHLNSADPRNIQVELVESADIGRVGVGEATFPSIRGTLSAIRLDERRFLAGSQATYKQGIRYAHWVRPPGSPGAQHYFHPFSLPSQRDPSLELLPYWLLGGAPGVPFAEAVTIQAALVEQRRAPKRLADADYQGALNHAYHFDAACFAQVLAEHGRGLGVRHRYGTVEQVARGEDGNIAHLLTREHGALGADLYVDCTGLRGQLIGAAMASPFRSRRHVLFVDRAVALQVPYARLDEPIASCTIATAQETGWIWDIGLQQRRGLGYVYSSTHGNADDAEAALRCRIGPQADALEALHIRFETGYRPEHWRGNCVAVGLAGGFVEPLESTGIALVELGAYLLTHLLPGDRQDMPGAARAYNRMMEARYERIIDFIKMHYCLSQRRDTAFWRDNTDPAGIPDTLAERLALWRHRPPHRLDFVTDLEMFLPASWQYVLYGMEFGTDLEPMRHTYTRMAEAQAEFAMIRHVAGLAQADLPDHRMLVEHMCGGHAGRGVTMPHGAQPAAVR